MSAEAVAWGDESSDAELITATRGGDSAAFGALYERHAAAARTVARQYTRSSADADDVVSDAFARVYSIVRDGGGPDVAFRAYLFTVVRRLAHRRVEAGRRVEPTDDMAAFESAFGPVSGVDDPALAGFERGVVAKAYGSLPERWQAVLWYTEIERLPPAQVGPLLGLTANGVAALAYRAREGLREAYLQQHLVTAPSESCRSVNGKLGAYVRGGLAKRESAQVRAHLETCEVCRNLVLELGDVNHGLRGIIAPLVLGVAGLGALTNPLPVGALATVGGGAAGAGTAGAGSAGAGAAVTSGTTATGAATTVVTTGTTVTGGVAGGAAGTKVVVGGLAAGSTAGGAATGTVAAGTVGTAAGAGATAGMATAAGATAVGASTLGVTGATAAGVATAGGATAMAGAGAASGAAAGIGGLLAAIPGGVVGVMTAGVVGVSLAVGGTLVEPATPPTGTVTSSTVTTGPDAATGGPGSSGAAGPGGSPGSSGNGRGPLFDGPALALPPGVEEPPFSGRPVAAGPREGTDPRPGPRAGAGDPTGAGSGTADPTPTTAPAPASFTATGSDVVLVQGADARLSITITNTGGTSATDLRAALHLPAGVELIGTAAAGPRGRWQPCPDGAGAPGAPALFCLAALDAGASSLLSTGVRVDPAAPVGPTAIRVDVGGSGAGTRGLSVPVTVRGDRADVQVGGVAQVTLTAGTPAPVSFVVGNTGDAPVRGLSATVSLPAGVRWTGDRSETAPWRCADDDGGVTCRLPVLDARPDGESAARADLTLTLLADARVVGVRGLAAVLTVPDAGGPGVPRAHTVSLVVTSPPSPPGPGEPEAPDEPGEPDVPREPDDPGDPGDTPTETAQPPADGSGGTGDEPTTSETRPAPAAPERAQGRAPDGPGRSGQAPGRQRG